jgi:hypothetical protein
MWVRVLGSAAGGGFPQWNCDCPACRAVRDGRPPLPQPHPVVDRGEPELPGMVANDGRAVGTVPMDMWRDPVEGCPPVLTSS